jgi:LysR family transcriptional regulator, transcriptional activator of nhaA
MPELRRLNFKHLRYFAAVAQQGSVTGAASSLHVAPQTVSAQLAELESAMGRRLFDRLGKRLELNADGEAALEYAKTIFALGEELVGLLAGRNAPRRIKLRVGVTDSVPKMMATKLLSPLISKRANALQLTCTEGPLNRLLGQALDNRLDLVLTDSPPSAELASGVRVRVLVNPGLSFLATRAIAGRHRGGFPERLDSMPFLLSSPDSAVALAIQQWLTAHGVTPALTGRFDDSALMKAFAEEGLGAIAVPSIVEREVCRHHGLVVLGRTRQIHHPVYAVASRRRQLHPLLADLFDQAKEP